MKIKIVIELDGIKTDSPWTSIMIGDGEIMRQFNVPQKLWKENLKILFEEQINKYDI